MSYGSFNKTRGNGLRSPTPSDQGADHDRNLPANITAGGEIELNEEHHSFGNWATSFYHRNFGLFLVLLAQVFGSLVS